MSRGLAFRRKVKAIKVTKKYKNVYCKCDYCSPSTKRREGERRVMKHKGRAYE